MAVGRISVRRELALKIALIATVALAAAGCGRRGGLEPPPNDALVAPGTGPGSSSRVRPVPAEQKTMRAPQSSATPTLGSTTDAPDDETVDANDAATGDPAASVAPIPTPAPPGSRRGRRNFTIPKEPFILDPIL